MLSIDTNILLYAFNQDSPAHSAAYDWITSIQRNENVAISEFILAEFYGLLRNRAVLRRPLRAEEAVEVIQAYRSHPRWRLIGFPTESRPVHEALWQKARERDFAFRNLFDVRTAFTMLAQGVTELATTNVKDFDGIGFRRVWNPISK
jgi:toxin-antitoxin system PIN domain toxin